QNVGITDAGSITPNYLLQLHKNSSGATSLIQFTNLSTGNTATDGFTFDVDGSFNLSLNNRENTFMAMRTNNTERMRILSTGELLVNSSSHILPAMPGDALSSFIQTNTNSWSINGVNTTLSGGGIFGCNTNASNGYNGIEGVTYGIGAGVLGLHIPGTTAGIGVYGTSNSSTTGAYGVYGKTFASGNGAIFGINACANTNNGSSQGLYGYSSAIVSTYTCVGVAGDVGVNNALNYNALYGRGRLVCTGTKSAEVATSKGPTLLYCLESPEVWFEDFGTGQLKDGYANIVLDNLFLETVTINDKYQMLVFIQLEGECANGVYVNKKNNSFEVIEQNQRVSKAKFSYRIVAKRKGNEDTRLEISKPTSVEYKSNMTLDEKKNNTDQEKTLNIKSIK
ncbi:MAG: hypothetical protein WCL06_14565, partial [Bacteroidota bacterium]